MFDFLFYLVFSLTLFGSVLVKVIVAQWDISEQANTFNNGLNYSNESVPLFFAQVFERFADSKFNVFTMINLFFALACQSIISMLNFFLDGLSANQKIEANKKFVSMIIKDLFFPFFFLTRHFFEYSYSTSFIFIFPIPFLLRYFVFLTRSFIDGLSISSKAKNRKFHQKLFTFQITLFTISYVLFIFFLNYYFYPNKFINKNNHSQNGSINFKSSLQNSLVSNMSHESIFKRNLQYIFERITLLKLKRIRIIEEKKEIKENLTKKQAIDLNSNQRKNEAESKQISDRNQKTNMKIETEKDNSKDKIHNIENNDNQVTSQSETNFSIDNDFYSKEDINCNNSEEMRNPIFIFLSFQSSVALFGVLYDIIRHIIFIVDFENYGNSEKSIRRQFINDIVFEIITITVELFFFFTHISYVLINLNNSMPSLKKLSKPQKLLKGKILLNSTSNTSNLTNITLIEKSANNSSDSFTDFASSFLRENAFPPFQGEVLRIAIYTPIFVMRSLILNAFYLATKLISYNKWKEMSEAIKNNLPDADEEDMKREMRCIICRLEMCTCKRKTQTNKNIKNKRKVKVKKKRSKNKKENSNLTKDDLNGNNNDVNLMNENNNYIDCKNNNNNEDLNDCNNNDEYEYEYEYYDCPKNRVDEDKEFVIRKGEIKRLPCGHCFHSQCLQNWAQRQMKCPLCQYDMKNILNPSIMLIHQLHPGLFRQNAHPDINDIHHEVAPNMFIPPEFVRNEENGNNRRNGDINENNHIRALRILTQVMLVLTLVLLIILIALIVSILMDVIDL